MCNVMVLGGECATGVRFETYIVQAEHGPGDVVVNGAAAHRSAIGHHLLFTSFASMTPEEMATHHPKVVICDERNGIAELIAYDPAPGETAGVSDSG